MISQVQVKCCCIESEADARVATRAGATALGFVSHMPSGPGVIDAQTLRGIAAASGDGGPLRVLLTSGRTADEIADDIAGAKIDAVQIVRPMPADVRIALAQRFPRLLRIQVLHVTGAGVLAQVEALSASADALLLDSGAPKSHRALASGAPERLGGTGQVHDWTIAAQVVRRAKLPVILAGGLRPDNVTEAIETVRPAAVDVCSGVRTDGRLDAEKIAAFVHRARAAFTSLGVAASS